MKPALETNGSDRAVCFFQEMGGVVETEPSDLIEPGISRYFFEYLYEVPFTQASLFGCFIKLLFCVEIPL
ncbi:hypothetical protein RZN69_11885 [Rubellicoccus peritrichatus]|uniref:Uncharacterized protein n=1 Tax=Rubellicoccus peritrichatus TaxID=3080537 RepID=A0AAQ3QTS7_9BACT|nr:hypothetical protein [Puniceicoccus sp. CR14]WOO39315.1 hypothetical protein RZN69_11885 [Puniceicoccus sp. CR14]